MSMPQVMITTANQKHENIEMGTINPANNVNVPSDERTDSSLIYGFCSCCTMSTMVAFLIIFIVQIIFILASKDTISENNDNNKSWTHFTNVMLWMYGIFIIETCAFLLAYFQFELWRFWHTKPHFFCIFTMVLFLTWIVSAMIAAIIYKSTFQADEITFRIIFGLVILFAFCGPIFVLCCLFSSK